ncbi:hypothetical protein [Parabacteroides sp.]
MKRLTEKEFNSQKASIKNTKDCDWYKEKGIAFMGQIKPFIPDAEYVYYINEEYNALERICIEFQREGITFIFRQSIGDKKYSIDIETNHLTQIERRDIIDIRKKYEKPCYIGKITQKKVDAWITYQTLVYKELLALNQAAEDKLAKFLKSIEGEKIHWTKFGKEGEIVKNGISFKFEITPGYISTKLSLHYNVSSSYDNFVKLSNNKYEL